MSEHKNQHVTPQVILKYFAFENKVHIYDTIMKAKPSNSYRTIQKVSTRNNFYDFNEKELKEAEKNFKKEFYTKYVEVDFLAHNIEDSLGKLLPVIMEKNFEEPDLWIDNKEKVDLSFHLAIQFLRSPLMKKLLSEIGNSINGEASMLSLSEYDSSAQEHLALHHYSLMTNPKLLTQIGGNFLNRDWTLCINQTELPFFTSDNPVVINEDNISQMIYPLSSKYLIIMDSKNNNGNICYISDIEKVKNFNRLQLRQCDKEVFSEKDCFDWITAVDLEKTNIHKFIEQKSFLNKYIQIILVSKKIVEGFITTGATMKPKTRRNPKKKSKKRRR
jgi:hypothetical protein